MAAHERKDLSGVATAAIELQDGTIITSRTSSLLGPSAALILNALKHLAEIPHSVKLIPEEMIAPIQRTKVSFLHGRNPRLHTDEVLVAISMLSNVDENCRKALDQLPKLDGCQVHSTVMLSASSLMQDSPAHCHLQPTLMSGMQVGQSTSTSSLLKT